VRLREKCQQNDGSAAWSLPTHNKPLHEDTLHVLVSGMPLCDLAVGGNYERYIRTSMTKHLNQAVNTEPGSATSRWQRVNADQRLGVDPSRGTCNWSWRRYNVGVVDFHRNF
jgi:hypothetical protein